jgi:hypothetical protein
MPPFKTPDLAQRGAASRDAKARALELLRNKAAPDPALVEERRIAREAREAADAERRAAHKAAIEAEKAARAQARAGAEAAANALKVEKRQLTPAEQKAIRDARYAARKARKK